MSLTEKNQKIELIIKEYEQENKLIELYNSSKEIHQNISLRFKDCEPIKLVENNIKTEK